MILENEVTIAGETVRKERFGMASIHDENKTFTGDVLYKDQVRNSYDNSIETKFQDTAQVDGLTVWKSNGEVPFADMLLDFVQIGAITFEQAEFSLIQKQKDQDASLETLFRADDGNIYLGEGALDYRDERLAKIETATWRDDIRF
tara:strand:+ start:59 stop:496 length:438 start_codon:yes stop_codon:yes gene_type:complete